MICSRMVFLNLEIYQSLLFRLLPSSHEKIIALRFVGSRYVLCSSRAEEARHGL